MPAPTVTYHEVKGAGLAHAKDTLRRMAKLAREGAHTYAIRHLATTITANVPSKQTAAELAAIYKWVRDNIRYRFDPLGIEWLQAPQRTVEERAGDCDDMTILLSALAQTLGHQVKYRTVGPTKTVQKHVALEARAGNRWISLDPVLEPPATTIEPRTDLGTFGRRAPGAAHHFDGRTGTMLNGFDPRMRPLWERTPLERRDVRAPRIVMVYRGTGAAGPRTLKAIQRQPVQDWPNPYDPTDLSGYDGLFDDIAKGVSSVAKSATKVVTAPVKAVAKVATKVVTGKKVKLSDLTDAAAATIPGAGALKPLHKVATGKKLSVMDVASAAMPGGRASIELAQSTHKLIHSVPGLSSIAMLVPGANVAMVALDAGIAALRAAQGKSFSIGALVKALPMANQIPGVAEVVKLAEKSGVTDIAQAISKAQKSGLVKGAGGLASLTSKVAKLTGKQPPGLSSIAKLGSSFDKKNPPSAATLAKLPKPTKLAPGASVQRVASALKARQAASMSAIAKAAKAIAPKKKKWPKGARKRWDPKGRQWQIVAPASSLSGVGAFRPTVTFTLGAAAAAGSSAYATQRAAAQKAIDAVRAFVKKNGVPPQIKLSAVTAFQATDAQLTDDGLYGPNSRAAAAWYLGVSEATLPAVAKPYQKYAVTWRAPVAVAATPAVTPKPAPKPVAAVKPAPKPVAAVKPAPKPAPKGDVVIATTKTEPDLPLDPKSPTPPKPVAKPATAAAPAGSSSASSQKSAASLAVSAVRNFIKKNGKPPAVALPAVKKFQATWPGLKTDGLWGEATRAAAAAALRVAVSTLPPVGVKSKATTTAKPAPKPAPKKTTKPATTKPAPSSSSGGGGPIVVQTPTGPVIATPIEDPPVAVPVPSSSGGGGGGGSIVIHDPGPMPAQRDSDSTTPWMIVAYLLWQRSQRSRAA